MPHVHSRPQSSITQVPYPPPSYASRTSSSSSSEFPRREQQYPSRPEYAPVTFDEFLNLCVNGEPYNRLVNTFSNEPELLQRVETIHHCVETVERLRAIIRTQYDVARRQFYEINNSGGQEILTREYRRPRRLIARRRPTPYYRRTPPVIVERSPSSSPDPNDIPLTDESDYLTAGSQENPIIIDEGLPRTFRNGQNVTLHDAYAIMERERQLIERDATIIAHIPRGSSDEVD
jgi:hypothetical protein